MYLFQPNAPSLLILFTATAILVSCGGGGSDNDGATTLSAPAFAAAPNLSFEPVKTFRISWVDVSDATFYRLMEQINIGSGFYQIGNDITQGVQTTTIVVPLHARINSQYILQSCNAGGCTDSASILVARTLVDSIGYFKASNSEGEDQFGTSVSLSADGNTLAVGARLEDSAANGIDGDESNNIADSAGAVYVFIRSSSSWSQQAYVKASNSESSDLFGSAVSLSADGDTLAVGANLENSAADGIGGNENDNTAGNAGAVYVFGRSGSSWSQRAYVKASNSDNSDNFGSSVSLSADGHTLAVSANGENSAANGIGSDENNNTAGNAGAVYVFIRSGNSWSQQAYVKASNSEANDQFGIRVSLSADGNTLAVGAHLEDSAAGGIGGDESDNTLDSAGAVYVFIRSSSSWSQQAYVKASNSESSDFFGSSVSLSADGNTLAVGAYLEDSAADGIAGDESDNTAANAGAVYMFSRSVNSWSQQAYIKASNSESSDFFGSSVGLSADGNTLVVGAALEDSAADGIAGDESDNTSDSTGAVYVFSRSGNSWSQQAYVKASNSVFGDRFGVGVSISADGNTLAVGAVGEDSAVDGIGGNENDNTAEGAGAVYLY